MSHVLTTPPATAAAEPDPPARKLPTPAPALITEQHVALSTAAAAAAVATRRWPHHALISRLGRILTELTQPRPSCPRREPSYFEAARMSRAMDRL
jgi:hypothetical protein